MNHGWEDDFEDGDFPDIHALFVYYNDLYFGGVLGNTTVEWSTSRMTSCGGVCRYHPLMGCQIRLSEPLLKLRPVRDLKMVLLHEMIHAHNMTLRIRDPDPGGHGPPFVELMNKINTSTIPDPQRPPGGYNITTTHSMIDEVNLYRTHWWECERCKRVIKRSMNRPPQEADCMGRKGQRGPDCKDPRCGYHAHIRDCGGNFIKIKEPDPKPIPAKGQKNERSSSPDKQRSTLPRGQQRLEDLLGGHGAGSGSQAGSEASAGQASAKRPAEGPAEGSVGVRKGGPAAAGCARGGAAGTGPSGRTSLSQRHQAHLEDLWRKAGESGAAGRARGAAAAGDGVGGNGGSGGARGTSMPDPASAPTAATSTQRPPPLPRELPSQPHAADSSGAGPLMPPFGTSRQQPTSAAVSSPAAIAVTGGDPTGTQGPPPAGDLGRAQLTGNAAADPNSGQHQQPEISAEELRRRCAEAALSRLMRQPGAAPTQRQQPPRQGILGQVGSGGGQSSKQDHSTSSQQRQVYDPGEAGPGPLAERRESPGRTASAAPHPGQACPPATHTQDHKHAEMLRRVIHTLLDSDNEDDEGFGVKASGGVGGCGGADDRSTQGPLLGDRQLVRTVGMPAISQNGPGSTTGVAASAGRRHAAPEPRARPAPSAVPYTESNVPAGHGPDVIDLVDDDSDVD